MDYLMKNIGKILINNNTINRIFKALVMLALCSNPENHLIHLYPTQKLKRKKEIITN
jgi:hypothetical protein